jgi:hypothetical protein
VVPTPTADRDDRPTHGDAQAFSKWVMRSTTHFRISLREQCYCTHLPEATHVNRAAVSPLLLGLEIKSLGSPASFFETSPAHLPLSLRGTPLLGHEEPQSFYSLLKHLIHNAWWWCHARDGHDRRQSCRGPCHREGLPHHRLCRLWRYLLRIRYWLDWRCPQHALCHQAIHWRRIPRYHVPWCAFRRPENQGLPQLYLLHQVQPSLPGHLHPVCRYFLRCHHGR